jgi:hypothetical protein
LIDLISIGKEMTGKQHFGMFLIHTKLTNYSPPPPNVQETEKNIHLLTNDMSHSSCALDLWASIFDLSSSLFIPLMTSWRYITSAVGVAMLSLCCLLIKNNL